ncbi:MAG TPA: 3-oxoadipate enol-lactonase [Conexibacter sp.]|nr:3-oxoadipate enol-lactonase [Conexibacter sp.]
MSAPARTSAPPRVSAPPRFRVEGPEDAPVLLLSGSLGSTLEMWEPQAAALARTHRVVRYDHPGHGGSELPETPTSIAGLAQAPLALLDAIGVARASVCGLSLGGMVAMWLAAHHPERVERLVLCCTSAALGPPATWEQRAAEVRAAGSVEPLADAVLARWLTPAYRAAHPAVAARLRALVAQTPAEGYARCCDAIRDWDGRDLLGAIRAPTVVVAGREDPSTPPEHAEAIVAGVVGARLELLSPAAHLASVEQAAAVNRIVAEHLSDGGGTG